MMSIRKFSLRTYLWLAVTVMLCCHPAAVAQRDTNSPPIVKNVIIFISDGCGYNQVDAAGLYQYGQSGTQVYESFPVQFGMSTYDAYGGYDPNLAWESFAYVRDHPTDSAAAATAMASGKKTYSSAIGVDLDENPLPNIIERAEQLGKATGVVTSVPFSHATPAAFVAHNADRYSFIEIADEMIYDSTVDVIMGCGHPIYDDDGRSRRPPDFKYIRQQAFLDLRSGLAGGDADRDDIEDPWNFIDALEDFNALGAGDTPKRVFALARVAETLQEYRDGSTSAAPYIVPMIDTVPTLVQMTRAALNVLDNDPDGFCVMIEGGAIDWACHSHRGGRMIEEQIDFNHAVQAAVEWVQANNSWDETIIIVTADHETGYLWGPGSGSSPRGPAWVPLVNKGAGVMPGVEWNSPTHTNSLVPFFANGFGAERFSDYIDGNDPVRGPYIDNTAIGKVAFSLLNHPPLADAGADVTAYADVNNTAHITPDAGNSYDPDGDMLTYRWSWVIDANVYEAEGVSPTIDLPGGEHTIELIVNDGIADSEPDYITATVVPPIEADVHILPSTIVEHNSSTKIFAIMYLPSGVTREQIGLDPVLVLDPGSLTAQSARFLQRSSGSESSLIVIAVYDKNAFLRSVDGQQIVPCQVSTVLGSGRYVVAEDIVTILAKPKPAATP
jgi:alkaline phosphatase